MKEERSFVYTLILGVCMLLCLLLIGKMLLHHPERVPEQPPENIVEQGDEQMELQLNENDLGGLILQALPFSPDGLTVKIGNDGRVEVGASVSKQMLEDSGYVTGGMRTALLFLPDPCKLYGVWRVSADNGVLKLDTERAEIAGFALPAETIDALGALVSETVNGQIKEWGVAFSKLTCEDGALLLQP